MQGARSPCCDFTGSRFVLYVAQGDVLSGLSFEVDIVARRFLNQRDEAEFFLPRHSSDKSVRSARAESVAIARYRGFRRYCQTRHRNDGTGAKPKHVDVAIRADRIVGVGDFKTAK